MSRAHDTSFVWGEMLDYWAATGQLSHNQIATATFGASTTPSSEPSGTKRPTGPTPGVTTPKISGPRPSAPMCGRGLGPLVRMVGRAWRWRHDLHR